MHLGLLIFSYPKELHGLDRIEQAAHELGHKLTRFSEPFFLFQQEKNRVNILYDGKPLPKIDMMIPRPNFHHEPSLHAYALNILLQAGLPMINSHVSFILCQNKLEQHIRFVEKKLPCPPFAIARRTHEALVAARSIGFPVVMKVAFGTHGKGVFFVPSEEVCVSVANYLELRDKNPMIIEKYIAEAERKDLRIFIVGEHIVAAMERHAPDGDIRTNTSNGGVGKNITLTKAEQELAKRAAKAFKLEVAGIDLIRSHHGPLVLEVNAHPGFQELERVTGVDIASAIVSFALEKIDHSK